MRRCHRAPKSLASQLACRSSSGAKQTLIEPTKRPGQAAAYPSRLVLGMRRAVQGGTIVVARGMNACPLTCRMIVTDRRDAHVRAIPTVIYGEQ